MKKPRVIIQTVSSHRIYVEHNGERTLYAVTDKLKEAKAFVLKAKRELGIARGSISKPSEARFRSTQRGTICNSHATFSSPDLCTGQGRRNGLTAFAGPLPLK
jgi:hypothetical protein